MRIDLSISREDYFKDLTTAEILRQYVSKIGPITIKTLRDHQSIAELNDVEKEYLNK